MAAARPSVRVKQTAGGGVAIGVTVDGVFVAVAAVTGPQVSFLVAKAKAAGETSSDSSTEDE